MNLPSRIEELLRHNSALHSVVLTAFSDFEPWFRSSGTPFFPEYTDHGPQHIIEVLESASSLIDDEAWSVLTANDVGMLCLATLLHDCAMHLTEDGFLDLVQNPTWQGTIQGEQPWHQLWTEFISEASRFDGRKLFDLFGNNEPIHRPDLDPIKWQLRDRLLIGEFLRRHHARLAHEISIMGVPGPHADRLKLKHLDPDLAGLAGLIARSHNLSLRDCLTKLSSTDPREYKGIHAVFIMALLRVADYLQMQSERAPSQLLQVRRLRSPISKREWNAHFSVVDIRHTHSDPEAIFVQAAPADAKSFLKLKKLIKGLQAELDGAWAVMGEVYGRFGPLAKLGLNIRRVISNLDDETSFAETISYIPVDAKFETAGSDLIKLLIHPLYGDHPEFGIRELMQNAIDACLELKDATIRTSIAENESTQVPDVSVELHEFSPTERYLIVSDRGIGMTSSIVLNYFLKAGASFRQSDAWKQAHQDETGRSRVLRSGRFGVGALAAFLIGDEIDVSTRHVGESADKGIQFRASLDSEEIELRFCNRPIGTTIRVRVNSDEKWDELAVHQRWDYDDRENKSKENHLRQWDFYCISQLNVKRSVCLNGSERVLAQKWQFPAPSSEIMPPWHRLAIDGYSDIHWRYQRGAPRLVCNGIVVEKHSLYEERTDAITGGLRLDRPTVSVFDPDGRLPLNLQRNGLAVHALPFESELRTSQCEDFIAWALVNAPSAPPTFPLSLDRYPTLHTESPRQPFAFVPEGTVLAESLIFQRVNPTKVIFVPMHADIHLELERGTILIPLNFEGAGIDASKAWFRCSVGWNIRNTFEQFEILKASGSRTIVRTGFYEALKKPGTVAGFVWSDIEVEAANKTWTLLRWGACKDGRIDFQKLMRKSDNAGHAGLTEYFHDESIATGAVTESTLASAWRKVTKEAIIPYEIRKRERTLRDAYEALSPLISYHKDRKLAKKTGPAVDSRSSGMTGGMTGSRC